MTDTTDIGGPPGAAADEGALGVLAGMLGAPLECSWTLPPELYHDDKVWEMERDRILHREWICVARQEQLSRPGDWLAVDVVGVPVVVTCDDDHRLHALSRTCRHRWMDVTGGEGRGCDRRLRCPYHAWTYSADGRLIGAPEMQNSDGFDKDANSLFEYGVEVWQGFVFVNLDPAAEPLGPRLAQVDAVVEKYRISDLRLVRTIERDVMAVDWKIWMENQVENYHGIGTHSESLEPHLPMRLYWVDDSEHDIFSIDHTPFQFSEEYTPEDALDFPRPPWLEDDESNEIQVISIFPLFCMFTHLDQVTWLEARPMGVDRFQLRAHLLVAPDALQLPDVHERIEKAVAGFCHIQDEDDATFVGVASGLRAPNAARGRLSIKEKGVHQFGQFYARRMTQRR